MRRWLEATEIEGMNALLKTTKRESPKTLEKCKQMLPKEL
jgi:hypothetical protein